MHAQAQIVKDRYDVVLSKVDMQDFITIISDGCNQSIHGKLPSLYLILCYPTYCRRVVFFPLFFMQISFLDSPNNLILTYLKLMAWITLQHIKSRNVFVLITIFTPSLIFTIEKHIACFRVASNIQSLAKMWFLT